MTPERWSRVKELFHEALERAPEQRAAFVSQVCARDDEGDDEVRDEVSRLLAAHAQAAGFIEQSPVAGTAADPKPPAGRCLTTGQVRGHYEILRLIGVGGMGEVYAARDLELERTVALKVVTGANPEAQAALRREAQHASQLNHPHICTIYEVGVWEGQAHIAMEYVEGETLAETVLPIETMLRYGIQIADALAYAHSRGLVHRDLKGANIVVTPDGRAKVLDFGLARSLPGERLKALSQSQASLTPKGMVSGTLSYLAPELLRGEDADARSDIWALGVLLYEMVAGVPPFTGATGFELSGAILHAPPVPLPAHAPASLQQIIRRCLAKEPRERFQQAGEIRAALEAVQSGLTDGTARGSVATPVERFLRSRAAVVTAVVLLSAIAAGAAMWRWNPPASAPVAVGASGRPAIAVMPFEIAGGANDKDTGWMSSGVPSMLLTGLAQTRGLDIVSMQRLREAVLQTGGGSMDSLDKNQAAAVARRAGAGAVVVGSIFKTGDGFRIDAQLEDLSSGRVLAADSVRGTDVFALVDQLAARMRDGAGFRDAPDIRRIADVSSSSLDAYRLYNEATNLYRNAHGEDAQRLLEEAVATDPSFGQAYVLLSFTTDDAGHSAAHRMYLRQAAERSDRLPERERLLVQVSMAREAGDSPRAAKLVDDLIARFPDFEHAYALATVLYQPILGPLYDPPKSVELGAKGVRALPSSSVVRNVYAYALLNVGKYAEGIRELETYARLAPREPNPYDSLGEAHLMLGEPERAIEYYSRALAVDPTFWGSHIGRAWAYSMLGRYDQALAENPADLYVNSYILSRVGKYQEADRVIASGVRQAQLDGNPSRLGGFSLLSALFAIERKDYARARRDLREAEQRVASLPDERKRVHLVVVDLLDGLADVRTGSLEAARRRLESLKARIKPDVLAERWWERILEGDITLAAGQPAQVASVYSGGESPNKIWGGLVFSDGLGILASNLPFRDGPARAAKARHDLAGAIAIYRSLLVTGPQQKWRAVFEPRYVLEIARLLDQSGDRAGAKHEYQRFLDLWAHADPDLPELAEARKAVMSDK